MTSCQFKTRAVSVSMGKKGRRAGKTGGDATGGGKAATKPKQGPGKARRERAAAQREIQARVEALIAKLDVELRDVELFGPPEEREECPICFVPMPLDIDECTLLPCCGKLVCDACFMAAGVATSKFTCAFCRSKPAMEWDATNQQLRSRIESGDAWAMYALGNSYSSGDEGVQMNHIAAMKLWLQAADSGHIEALCSIANKHFQDGFEVKITEDQALKVATAAAKNGSLEGHHLVGGLECKVNDDFDKALKHFVRAATGGYVPSFKTLRNMRDKGGLPRDVFDDIEEQHKEALTRGRSEERDAANKIRKIWKAQKPE